MNANFSVADPKTDPVLVVFFVSYQAPINSLLYNVNINTSIMFKL